MKKRDFVLLGAIILAAALLWIAFELFGSRYGDTVQISVDGEVYGEWSLFTDRRIPIVGTSGNNVAVIEGGKCYMIEADCPDGICVSHRPISRTNETIICLPHRVVITVTAGGGNEADDGIDATTR